MKKINVLLMMLAVLGLSACTTAYLANAPYDEVYSVSPAPQQAKAATSPAPSYQGQATSPDAYSRPARQDEYGRNQSDDYRDYSTAQQQYAQYDNQAEEYYSEPDRTVYVDDYSGSGFDYDDYYDYSYSVRIKRFHRPITGFSYYNNFYTNAYWYNYDPWYWGSSVYLGYNWWWDGYWGPSFSLGWNWGWGSIGWHWGYPYSGWYNPHWGYGGWGYWAGYNHGWYDGFRYGSYYNSFDNNSYYYGPRISRQSSNGSFAGSGGGTFGEYYENRVNQRRIGAAGGQATPGENNAGQTPQGSLNQRRITASGATGTADINDSKQAATGGSDNLNNRRITAGDAASKTATDSRPVEQSTGSNPRINPGRQDVASPRPASGENETGNTRSNRLKVNDGQPAAAPATTNDTRTRTAQERYSSPQGQQPAQRYDYDRYRRPAATGSAQELARPRNESTQGERQTRTYTPPAYSQPRSSDVYTTPRPSAQPSQSRQEEQGVQRSQPQRQEQQTTPQRQIQRTPRPQENQSGTREVQRPANQGSTQRYSPPARTESQKSYTPPAATNQNRQSSSPSYRAPAQNNYSAPAASPSNSSPSRSGGSSGNSSGSGGGGSSSGRRR